MLMVGEAKVYKPLFIQPLGRLLQQFDLLSVVLDEVVIGGDNIGNPALGFDGGTVISIFRKAVRLTVL